MQSRVHHGLRWVAVTNNNYSCRCGSASYISGGSTDLNTPFLPVALPHNDSPLGSASRVDLGTIVVSSRHTHTLPGQIRGLLIHIVCADVEYSTYGEYIWTTFDRAGVVAMQEYGEWQRGALMTT
jgi:hypothetical protein